ncbi:MAG: ABC transporter ATP-binding protein [Candidatus Competibacterales bacterium]
MNSLGEFLAHLRIFQTYIGPRMYLVFALSFVAALAEGFGLIMGLPLLKTLGADMEGESGVADFLGDLLQALGFGESPVAILAIIGVVFGFKGVVSFAAGAYAGHLQAVLVGALRGRMFDAYSRMGYDYYTQRNTGHFINVINEQINGFYRCFNAFIDFSTGLIAVFSYFVLAFVVAWRFGAMALLVGMLMLGLFRYLNSHVRLLSRQSARESGQLSKLLIQCLQAFKYLAATGQVEPLRGGVMASIQRLTGYQRGHLIAAAFTRTIAEPVAALFIIAIVIFQIAVMAQPLAPIIVSIVLFHRGLILVLQIQGRWQTAMELVGSVELVHEEFATQQRRREVGGTRPLRPLTHGIELKDVHFAYGPHLDPVIKGVSLVIPARTTVALVGESGAGKSTLVDLLVLLLRPQRGQLLIDGTAAEEVDLGSWRRQIGYVAQETVVFDDTLANNICLWAGDIDRDPDLLRRVEEAAQRAHIAPFIQTLPEGYHTVVGDRGVRLSGGQRQRLFIARELFKEPNLLILDEATSALDSESEDYIQQSIDALKGQMTVVIIAHRLATIRNVDRIYVLDRGRLVEQGSYHELRDAEASRFKAMVAMQRL